MNYKIGDIVGWSGSNSYTGIILDIYDTPGHRASGETIVICWIASLRRDPIFKSQHLPADHHLIIKKENK